MAMGWHVTVLRQDRRVAVWQAPVDGLRWLDDLVDSGDGRRLPSDFCLQIRLSARAGAALPILSGGPPVARAAWVSGPSDIIVPTCWPGKTVIDRVDIAECQPDEWFVQDA